MVEDYEENRDYKEGMKYDTGKLRWDLVQPLAVNEYIRVLTYGANKYAPNSWQRLKDCKGRYFAALLRHVWDWWRGEDLDKESGIHHLAHAMCNVAFLLEPELEKLKAELEAGGPVGIGLQDIVCGSGKLGAGHLGPSTIGADIGTGDTEHIEVNPVVVESEDG